MRKVFGNAWFVRAFTASAVALFVVGFVAYVQSRPDPSPATNTTTYPRDYELPVTTQQYSADDVPKEARRVAGEFILAAAGREDLAKAWKITHPELRAQCGCSYKEWLTGNIPVQYYPSQDIDTASFEVADVGAKEIYLRVLLLPKKGKSIKPQVFEIGLKATGETNNRTWRVNYWAPKVSIPVPATPEG
jgi:hypothetical protein